MIRKNLVVENAHIAFRNFSGKESKFNRAGDRNFCVIFDKETGEELKEQGINIDTKIIIRNIVLNYLSNYLNKEKNNIINLQKSQTKERKRYLI